MQTEPTFKLSKSKVSFSFPSGNDKSFSSPCCFLHYSSQLLIKIKPQEHLFPRQNVIEIQSHSEREKRKEKIGGSSLFFKVFLI